MTTLSDDEHAMYADFMHEHQRCWACGYSPFVWPQRQWMRPELHNAHIFGGPNRRHDRRCLVRLCEGCHRLHHRARIVVDGEPLPFLTLQNVLWLKKHRDGKHYDRRYLSELWAKPLPRIAIPAAWFRVEYELQPDLRWLPGQNYKDPPR